MIVFDDGCNVGREGSQAINTAADALALAAADEAVAAGQAAGRSEVVERAESSVGVNRRGQKAVNEVVRVVVESHDLPGVIDPIGEGALKSASSGIGVVE